MIACGPKVSWDIDKIYTSLSNYRPVWVEGTGTKSGGGTSGVYPFLIDGYLKLIVPLSYPYSNITTDLNYIHANFGFGGGSQDGYFLMDNNTGSSVSLETVYLIFSSRNLKIMPDLRKK